VDHVKRNLKLARALSFSVSDDKEIINVPATAGNTR
jgi:hypothetical protein